MKFDKILFVLIVSVETALAFLVLNIIEIILPSGNVELATKVMVIAGFLWCVEILLWLAYTGARRGGE